MANLETVSTLRTVGEHVELDLGTDLINSPRYNDDIAPTRASQRTWSRWNVASLWVGMAICVPTYTLGGVLTAYFGLSVSEALWTILIANVIVLIPLTLNAYPGTQCLPGHALWHSLPRRVARILRHHWFKRSVADTRTGRLRLVRRANAVWRHCDSPVAVGPV
jgi:hypothetical protein